MLCSRIHKAKFKPDFHLDFCFYRPSQNMSTVTLLSYKKVYYHPPGQGNSFPSFLPIQGLQKIETIITINARMCQDKRLLSFFYKSPNPRKNCSALHTKREDFPIPNIFPLDNTSTIMPGKSHHPGQAASVTLFIIITIVKKVFQ